VDLDKKKDPYIRYCASYTPMNSALQLLSATILQQLTTFLYTIALHNNEVRRFRQYSSLTYNSSVHEKRCRYKFHSGPSQCSILPMNQQQQQQQKCLPILKKGKKLILSMNSRARKIVNKLFFFGNAHALGSSSSDRHAHTSCACARAPGVSTLIFSSRIKKVEKNNTQHPVLSDVINRRKGFRVCSIFNDHFIRCLDHFMWILVSHGTEKSNVNCKHYHIIVT